MPGVHRNSDSRACGAVTQSSSTKVRVNGRDIVLQGDNNSHGGGPLRASVTNVRANGKPIIILNNSAAPDSLCGVIGHGGHGHCNPKATSASGNVNAG
tara:strand:- start:1875 stop:2168 length:294 start_codon:yes stop_codon:yes gene_type:complete